MAAPPRLAVRLVTASLAPGERAAVLGDLEEEFADRAGRDDRAARRWYWRQAIRSAAPNLIRRIRNHPDRIGHALVMWSILVTQGVSHALEHHDFWLALYVPGISLVMLLVYLAPRPKIKTRVQAAWLVGIGLLLMWGMMSEAFARPLEREPFVRFLMAPTLAVFILVRFWPWWPKNAEPLNPPPAEFRARWRVGDAADRLNWLSVGVPNAPLGLSGLVLARARSSADPEWVRAQAPTIDRTFRPADTLAINAAIRADESHLAARVDLVDSAGRIARTVAPVVMADRLEVVPARGTDLLSDREKHVAAIAATLPLDGLPPGAYNVCLTVVGPGGTAHRDERLVVAPSRS